MNKKRIKNILYRIIQKEMAFCELENMPNKKRVQLCNDYGTLLELAPKARKLMDLPVQRLTDIMTIRNREKGKCH